MKKILITLAVALCAAGAFNALQAKGKNNKVAASNAMNTMASIYKELNLNYVDTIDPEATMRVAIEAMLQNMDPYTEYYGSKEQQEILSVSTGQYAGVGSVITKQDSIIIFSSPYYDSPAWQAGVRHGDEILAIDSTAITAATTTQQASSMLKGRPGTDVTVKIRRPFVADSLQTITITRGTIKINPLPFHGYIGQGAGYLRITTFNDNTAAEAARAISDLLADQRVKGIILDLRDNGGGVMTGAVQLVSNFVPKGTTVLETRGREPRLTKTYKTTKAPQNTTIPLIVLIDNGTASASEIVSGALQDLDRAVVLGTRSYGKGLVQSIRPMPNDGILKITTGRYYIPSGRLVQAIEYGHDPDGQPKRIPDSLTTVYYTMAGRPVRDGGGITPDSIIALPKPSRLMYNLITEGWIDRWANRISNTQPHPDSAQGWQLPAGAFDDFVATLDTAKVNYRLPYAEGIEYLRTGAREEGYLTPEIEAQMNILAQMLRPDLQRDLVTHRTEIEDELRRALLERYFSDSEQVALDLPFDATVLAAIEMINKPLQYQHLLTPTGAPSKPHNHKKRGKTKK